MSREPFRGANLFVPFETALRILSEFHVVRRIGVDKILGIERYCLEVNIRKLEPTENVDAIGKVTAVFELLVTPEGDIEAALLVEATEPVIGCSIQVVENLGGLR